MHPAAHQDPRTVRRDAPGSTAPPGGSPGSGVAEWNLTTDEVYWSPEVFEIFGRDRSSGALTLDQLPAHLLPDDQLPLQGMVTAALVDGRPLAGEFRLVRPDGTVRTVHCTGEPVVGADGHAESLWLSLRDVSGHRATASVARAPGGATPPPDPVVLEAAARGPADASAGWCDTLRLPDGGMLLALGSVAPGDPDGGAGPATLRDALRGMALAGAGPARMLQLLDGLLPQCALAPPQAALCCHCAPGVRPDLVWAQAGGPGPLLVRDGEVRWAGSPGGPGDAPGAAPEPSATQRRIGLRPGDVVLCTTGERHLALLGPALGGAAPRLAAAASAAECADLAFALLTGAGTGPDAPAASGVGVLALLVR